MAAGAASYQGDEALAKLLAAAGSAMNVGALRDLLAGVLAAPEGEDSEAWMVLAAVDPTDDLRAQLGALKRELAAAGGGAVPDHVGRLAALRAELARCGLAGFAVPHADEHESSGVEARDAYLRALEADPSHLDSHLNLGRLLHEARDFRGAENHYRSALEISPKDATAAFNLGVVLEDIGLRGAAIEAYYQTGSPFLLDSGE